MPSLWQRLGRSLLRQEYADLQIKAQALESAFRVRPWLFTPQDLLREMDQQTLELLRRQLNYSAIIGGDTSELDRLQVVEMARHYYNQADPLVWRMVSIWTDYGFGQHIQINCNDPGAQKVVDAFAKAPANKGIMSDRELHKLSDTLLIDGEIFFLFFVSSVDGAATIRRIPTEQITDIKCDPDDADVQLLYKREWTPAGGQRQALYYRDWTASDENVRQVLATIGDGALAEARNLATPQYVMHVPFNTLAKRGWPMVARAIPWAEEYRRFLEARAAVAASKAQFVRKATAVGGGSRAVDAIKSFFASSLQSSGADWERNPPAAPGSTLATNSAVDVQDLGLGTGATDAQIDGMTLAAQAGVGMGIPPHLLGRPDAMQNRATARETLGPLMRQLERYQVFWSSVFRDIVDFVLTQAEQHGGKKFADHGATITMDSPFDADLGQVMDGLGTLGQMGAVTPKVAARIALAMPDYNVQDLDGTIEEMFPEGKGEQPAAPEKKEPESEQPEVEEPDASAEMTQAEAVAMLEAAARVLAGEGLEEGGAGSGHWGHAGVKGQRGGSAPSGGLKGTAKYQGDIKAARARFPAGAVGTKAYNKWVQGGALSAELPSATMTLDKGATAVARHDARASGAVYDASAAEVKKKLGEVTDPSGEDGTATGKKIIGGKIQAATVEALAKEGIYISTKSGKADASLGEIKRQIAKSLAQDTGLTGEQASKTIHQWAVSSNDSSMKSLTMQWDVAQVFTDRGVKLSAWQEQRLKDVSKAQGRSVHSHSVRHCGSEEKQQAFIKRMYDNTQRVFQKMGLAPNDYIEMYRGIALPGANLKPGQKTVYTGNAAESWTVNRKAAEYFGKMQAGLGKGDTYVIKARVRVKDILSTCRTGYGCYHCKGVDEHEMVVLGMPMHVEVLAPGGLGEADVDDDELIQVIDAGSAGDMELGDLNADWILTKEQRQIEGEIILASQTLVDDGEDPPQDDEEASEDDDEAGDDLDEGGAGSGNYGHIGIPGHHGGSQPTKNITARVEAGTSGIAYSNTEKGKTARDRWIAARGQKPASKAEGPQVGKGFGPRPPKPKVEKAPEEQKVGSEFADEMAIASSIKDQDGPPGAISISDVHNKLTTDKRSAVAIKKDVCRYLEKHAGMTAQESYEFIRTWASTSNDTNINSLTLQKLAAEKMGQKLPKYQADRLKQCQDAGHTLRVPEEKMRVAMDAIYKRTQAAMKKAGIKPDDLICVERGVNLSMPHSKVLSPGQTMDMHPSPLESYTTRRGTAQSFAVRKTSYTKGYEHTEPGAAYVVRSFVPARNIFSTFRTGHGCANEYEMLVLGKPRRSVIVYSAKIYKQPTATAQYF